MTSDARIHEIDSAYRRLSAATEEDLARAERELAGKHVRRVRLDNAEARTEPDHQHARREVDRLHLIVCLLETRARG